MFSKSTGRYAVLQILQRIAERAPIARTRNAIGTTLLVLAALVPAVEAASAQGGARLGYDSSRGRERKPPTAQQVEERRKMIAEFEQRIDNLVRTRLQATDDQMVKMRVLKKRFDDDKNQLFKDEGDLRRAMRVELTGAAPNEARLTQLLEQWPALQRRRIEIEEREQKELARFLQPLQRARFFALQDELRRARQDTQWGRGERGGRGGPPWMPSMRRDSTDGRSDGSYRGGGGGGRGSKPSGKDTVIKK